MKGQLVSSRAWYIHVCVARTHDCFHSVWLDRVVVGGM